MSSWISSSSRTWHRPLISTWVLGRSLSYPNWIPNRCSLHNLLIQLKRASWHHLIRFSTSSYSLDRFTWIFKIAILHNNHRNKAWRHSETKVKVLLNHPRAELSTLKSNHKDQIIIVQPWTHRQWIQEFPQLILSRRTRAHRLRTWCRTWRSTKISSSRRT